MISHQLETLFNQAIVWANERRHEYLILEGILLSLIDDPTVAHILTDRGVNLPELKKDLQKFLDNEENFSILSDEEIDELSFKQFSDENLRKLAVEKGIRYQPEIGLSLQRVIQRALLHVQSSGKSSINAVNILIALFSEKESYAVFLLQKHGVSRVDVVSSVAHSVDRPKTADAHGPKIDETDPLDKEQGQKKILEEFTVNLNEVAKKGRIDPLIGREKELERIVQVLCRRRKNNPLMVGDSGVGKTAIAEGLALAIVEKNVPEFLLDTTIYSLDMATLLAGTKFRGDFEERFKTILNALQKKDDGRHHSIIFIDEIHTIIGAGATAGGHLDASNLLKPALASGQIRCLGSTTYDEYRKYFEKDQALNRRFQKVDVDEPSVDDTLKILQGLKSKFEKHHDVKYPTESLKAAVDLAQKHITNKKLPDKAIDVIDEAGARVHLRPKTKKKATITVEDIEEVVSTMARIPKKSVSVSDRERIQHLGRDLKMMLFGQDEAVEKVVNAIYLSKAGINRNERPIANFLFAGPTGVGKTELARQLAFSLGIHFERFDMSEYMEKHSVAKLIGAPPGYVGFDQGGLLTDAVHKNPHCVLLLDEIEKAHEDIYNILLQVMDHGKLMDSNGRASDFRSIILIMTTNAGARDMEASSIGLSKGAARAPGKRDQAIKNFFSPEFRNRLDAIIHFNKLGDSTLDLIVNKFIVELELQLREKDIEIEVSPLARRWLGQKGYDEKLGARPIARVVDEHIKKNLAQEILFGKLMKGGKVVVDLSESELIFQYHPKK